MFSAESKTTGREQADITGLIGQYAHGNEPSHHAAFLYGYTGLKEDHDKMVALVQRIMNELYTTAPDGLCGNEDCGQMSAWYVLAKNNVYSTVPGMSGFQLIDPNEGMSPKLGHMPVAIMSELPSIQDHLITPLPVIQGPNSAFEFDAKYDIYCSDQQAQIISSAIVLDEQGQPTRRKIENPAAATISERFNQSMRISAYATSAETSPSDTITATFYKKNNNYKVLDIAKYDHQYHAGGDLALVDGLRGSNDFRIGAWQGYRDPFAMTIDLGEEKKIGAVRFSCLEDIKSWIWYPQHLMVYGSLDGVNFTAIGQLRPETADNDYTPKHQEFAVKTTGQYRFVKVVAEQKFNRIPDWHLGAGGSSWIFLDEIVFDFVK
jgi:hypothetical protein